MIGAYQPGCRLTSTAQHRRRRPRSLFARSGCSSRPPDGPTHMATCPIHLQEILIDASMAAVQQLHMAAECGDAAGVAAALAAGVPVDSAVANTSLRHTALHRACLHGHADCARLLLQAGANPNSSATPFKWTPLHNAARGVQLGHTACAAALLAAGADPYARGGGSSALHVALDGRMETVSLLLEASPELALQLDPFNRTPLQLAVAYSNLSAAALLLAAAPLQPAVEILQTLSVLNCVRRFSLYSSLVARQALNPSEWALVPSPCPGLGTTLPAVLRRSEAEAALLVRHLPVAEVQRLRTFALCLARRQRQAGMPELPAPITAHLLALSVA